MPDWDGGAFGDGAEASVTRGPPLVKLGLMGYGPWGQNWARVMEEAGVLAWIVDPRGGVAAKAHEDYPQVQVAQNSTQLAGAVDGVVIATPASNHYKSTLYALRQGWHVLVEKPGVATVDELKHIVQEVTETGLVYMVDYTFLFALPVLHLAEVAEEIAPLRYARCSWTGPGKYRDDVDVIGNVGPHPLSVLLALTGRAPDRVAAIGRKWNTSSRDYLWDYAHAVLYWDSEPEEPFGDPCMISRGFTASIDLSWCDPEKTRHIVLTGHNGSAICDPTLGEIVVLDSKGKRVARDMRAGPEPLASALQAFVEHMARGQQPIGCGLIGTTHMTQTIEMIRASARAEVEVNAPDPSG